MFLQISKRQERKSYVFKIDASLKKTKITTGGEKGGGKAEGEGRRRVVGGRKHDTT